MSEKKLDTLIQRKAENGIVEIHYPITRLDNVVGLKDEIEKQDIHIGDEVRHIKAQERSYWNAKAETTTATPEADGLLSADDKVKLDGIEERSNRYVHPDSGVAAGAYRNVKVNAQGHVTEGSNPILAVEHGGTGAVTAADARKNLDVPPASHASSSATYGVGTASNYGHTMASSTVPLVAGTASAGTDNGKYAREGHVHPVQTSVSGNAGRATKLATARKIGLSGGATGTATSFDGTADITIPVTDLNMGNATAGTLLVGRGGTGAANAAEARKNLDVPPADHASADNSYGVGTVSKYGHTMASSAAPLVAGTASAGTDNGKYAREGHVHPVQPNVSGNAGTATKLATARTIAISGGATGTATSFDGSGNITIPVTGLNMGNATAGTLAVGRGGTGAGNAADARKNLDTPPADHASADNDYGVGSASKYGHTMASSSAPLVAGTASAGTDNGKYAREGHVHPVQPNVSGNAGTATKLATARKIGISGGATGTATSFDGSGDITIPITGLNMGNATAGTLAVGRGGTGAATAADARSSLGVPPTSHASAGTSYGVGSASNYGHAMASSAAPLAAGTATAGTDNGKYAREGHVHPVQTTVSGNAGSATKLVTSRAIDGVNFNGESAISHYGTCSTAAGTAAKTVVLSGYTLTTGARVAVKFTVTNTAASPTLNVNGTGAKAIQYRGSAISAGYLAANRTYEFVYDGTNYQLVGDINTDSNTTYSAGTGLKLSSNTFSHENYGTAGSTGPSGNASPGYGGTFVVPQITTNAQGHVTAAAARTITMPSSQTVPSAYTSTPAMNGSGSAGSNAAYSRGDHVHPTDSSRAPKSHASSSTDYGIGSSSNYGHAMASSATPQAAGTAAAGTDNGKYAREGHVHPAQTTVSGNAGTATKLVSGRAIDGVTFDGSSAITHYGTCSTGAGTAAKTVSLTNFTLVTGARIAVKFTITNTAASPTLNVNSTGAKAIQYRGSAISAGYLAANRTYEFVYDGTNYQLVGDINTNTTYTAGTALTLSGTAFNHDNYGSAGSIGPGGNSSPGYGGTFVVPQITTNAQGHVTAAAARTITMPSSQTIPSAYTATPAMNGSGSAGSNAAYSRGDHVHPTDSGRAPKSHASSSTDYGVATTSNYGHVKVTTGNGLNLSSGTLSMGAASTGAVGGVQLNNTLTSTSTTQAATANVAKTLSDKIDTVNSNLAVNIVDQMSTNLNNYKKQGIFFFNATVAPTNVPIGTNGWLLVLNNGNLQVKQYWFRQGSLSITDQDSYLRTYSSTSDEWGVWHKLLTDKDVRIETGQAKINISETNRVYRHKITFNQQYRKIPTISVSVQSTTPHQIFVGYTDLSLTEFTITLLRSSGTGNTTVSWSAITREHAFTIV